MERVVYENNFLWASIVREASISSPLLPKKNCNCPRRFNMSTGLQAQNIAPSAIYLSMSCLTSLYAKPHAVLVLEDSRWCFSLHKLPIRAPTLWTSTYFFESPYLWSSVLFLSTCHNCTKCRELIGPLDLYSLTLLAVIMLKLMTHFYCMFILNYCIVLVCFKNKSVL